jgi:hypothetical protein
VEDSVDEGTSVDDSVGTGTSVPTTVGSGCSGKRVVVEKTPVDDGTGTTMTVIVSVSTGSSVHVLDGSTVSVADGEAVSVEVSAIVPSPSPSSGVHVDDAEVSVAEADSLGTSVGEAVDEAVVSAGALDVSVAVEAGTLEDEEATVSTLNGASVTWKSAMSVLGLPPAFWIDDWATSCEVHWMEMPEGDEAGVARQVVPEVHGVISQLPSPEQVA